MSQISLLILDGAHEAHHGNPYSHLMLDYYHASPESERPRFIGMMDAAVPVTPDLLFVESTCNATIFGLSAENRAILRSRILQPDEIVTFYEPATVKRDTTLYTQLKTIDPDGKVLKHQFAGASAT